MYYILYIYIPKSSVEIFMRLDNLCLAKNQKEFFSITIVNLKNKNNNYHLHAVHVLP